MATSSLLSIMTAFQIIFTWPRANFSLCCCSSSSVSRLLSMSHTFCSSAFSCTSSPSISSRDTYSHHHSHTLIPRMYYWQLVASLGLVCDRKTKGPTGFPISLCCRVWLLFLSSSNCCLQASSSTRSRALASFCKCMNLTIMLTSLPTSTHMALSSYY